MLWSWSVVPRRAEICDILKKTGYTTLPGIRGSARSRWLVLKRTGCCPKDRCCSTLAKDHRCVFALRTIAVVLALRTIAVYLC